MKNNSTITFGVLCIYIASLVGWTIAKVGMIPECTPEPYTWELPFVMFIFTSVPALLGYFVGMDK